MYQLQLNSFIYFEIKDHRFPTIATDVVKIKWTMGTKKDVLFLNDKSTTVENWDNILKTAGFLRGNCFVIHQGIFLQNFSREKCPRDAGKIDI